MAEAGRDRVKKGAYVAINDGEAFAALLTDHLQEVSHDKHLRVNCSARVLPKGEPGPNPEAEARMRTQMQRNNCFFEKAERLPPNIGLLKFNGFADPAVCGPTVPPAMNLL